MSSRLFCALTLLWAFSPVRATTLHRTGDDGADPTHEASAKQESAARMASEGKQVFRGALTACRPNGSPTDYRALPDHVELKPMRVVSILMTEEDGTWRPARADDPSRRCEWVFTNGKGEIEGRLFPPGQSSSEISVVWGPMCGRPGGKFMYVPSLANPWVYVPSCSVQSDSKFVPIVAVDEGRKSDGRELVREIPIPPDPDWRRKYGFLDGVGKVAAKESVGFRMSVWGLRALRQWQRTHPDGFAAGDLAPEPNPPADGKQFCKRCL